MPASAGLRTIRAQQAAGRNCTPVPADAQREVPDDLAPFYHAREEHFRE